MASLSGTRKRLSVCIHEEHKERKKVAAQEKKDAEDALRVTILDALKENATKSAEAVRAALKHVEREPLVKCVIEEVEEAHDEISGRTKGIQKKLAEALETRLFGEYHSGVAALFAAAFAEYTETTFLRIEIEELLGDFKEDDSEMEYDLNQMLNYFDYIEVEGQTLRNPEAILATARKKMSELQ